ncbi:MAG: glutamate racemase [Deltaproteobacteria bacterium]
MKNNINPVAFFDSGIGGLSVLRQAISKLPYENYIYYADTKNVPYGTKPKEDIVKYIFEAVEFLAANNIKILVVACNTATSAAVNDLRAKYDFPIIGMEPAVKPAIEKNKSKRILVTATSFTLRERKLESLISDLDKNNIIDKLALDSLVGYAENFDFKSVEVKEYIKERLSSVIIEDYETIVLGCTHFIFFKKIMQEMLPPHIEIIDGNEGTVNQMLRVMENNRLLKTDESKSLSFFSSGFKDTQDRVKKLKEVLKMKI